MGTGRVNWRPPFSHHPPWLLKPNTHTHALACPLSPCTTLLRMHWHPHSTRPSPLQLRARVPYALNPFPLSLGSHPFDLTAFTIPAGLAALVPLYQHGLMHGSEDMREMCATALGELALYSSSDALKPFLTKITGPLIRIVGDKFNAKVTGGARACLGEGVALGGISLFVCSYDCLGELWGASRLKRSVVCVVG
jgi:hypothetical protein